MAQLNNLTWARTYTYPKSLKRYTKGDSHLYFSNNPLYMIYGGNKTSISINDPYATYSGFNTNYNLYFRILIKREDNPTLFDISFNLNGKTYSNVNNITGANQFLKTSNPIDFYNSIETMFNQSGLLELFNYSPPSNPITTLPFFDSYAGYTRATFYLRAKNNGAIPALTSDMLRYEYTDQPSSINLLSPDVTFGYAQISNPPLIERLSPTNTPIVWISYTEVIGENIAQDVEQYQIGVDIFKLTGENSNSFNQSGVNEYYNYLTSLSKKGIGLGDFDLSSIVNNSINEWLPTINDFNLNVPKYVDKFKIRAWQKWNDKSVTITNTYVNQFYDDKDDRFYVVDGYNKLFEDYEVPSLAFDNQIAQTNLEETNAGTYGLNNINVYDKNLTRQPRYKKLNQSFEILCNQVYNIKQTSGSLHNDKVYFEFFYNNGSNSEVVVIDSSVLQPFSSNGGSLRWINQLSFNTKTLKNRIQGDWNSVYLIEVHFFNPVYRGNLPIHYEVQQYYIDATIQSCDDDTFDDGDYLPIVFKNSRGGFDLFEFDTVTELKTKRDYASFTSPYTYKNTETSEFEKVYNLNYNKNYSAKTRVLTDEEFDWLEDLIKAKKVYVLNLDNNQLYPIIISDTDYSYKVNTDKQITITFNYSRPEVTA